MKNEILDILEDIKELISKSMGRSDELKRHSVPGESARKTYNEFVVSGEGVVPEGKEKKKEETKQSFMDKLFAYMNDDEADDRP